MAWFTFVNYCCFSNVVMYVPRGKDLEVLLLWSLYFFRKILLLRKLFTLRLKGVKSACLQKSDKF